MLFDAFTLTRRSTCTRIHALAFIDAGSDILYVRIIDEKKLGENLRQVTAGALKDTFSTR